MHINIYSKQITITYIRIFMNSYNKLIHILVLITDLCLFRSLVGVTKLILILILLADLYLYKGTHRYIKTYTYTEVLVGILRVERCPLL